MKSQAPPTQVLIEAEHFADLGGWTLDTEFWHCMGSPYLMAHGLGHQVTDAVTPIRLPSAGAWRVWVRTLDWVAKWKAPGAPGRFQLLINNRPCEVIFGTEGADWHWQNGGVVHIEQPEVTLALHDLTGFNARCDAICFSSDLSEEPPSNASDAHAPWRIAAEAGDSSFDLVVVGAGYAGMCAALTAARRGLAVALVQDRPVPGGNGSSEIAVNLRGLIPADGPFPRLGTVLRELEYDHDPSARTPQSGDDTACIDLLQAEPNLTLLLNHCVTSVRMDGNRIAAARIRPTRHVGDRWLRAHCFVDCTGHGTLGALAGADFAMATTNLCGMTNLWSWDQCHADSPFPDIPWAIPLDVDDFPMPPQGRRATWNWESGFDRHPIHDLEAVRDWNLRAIFSAWRAVKHGPQRETMQRAALSFVAAIGGTRESRRLLGDHELTEQEMLERQTFDDGFVPVTWHLDRHQPHPDYKRACPDNPFIAREIPAPPGWKEQRPRHADPWWGIPFRCLYSRNLANLFMAGRNISTNYHALGAVRVQRTCGLMGEVVGHAAAICCEKDCLPREVYDKHLHLLKRCFE